MSENSVNNFTRIEEILSEKSQYVLAVVVLLAGLQLFQWGRKLREISVANQKLSRDNKYLKKGLTGSLIFSGTQILMLIIRKIRN